MMARDNEYPFGCKRCSCPAKGVPEYEQSTGVPKPYTNKIHLSQYNQLRSMLRFLPAWLQRCFAAPPEADVNDTLTRAAGLLPHEPTPAPRARLGPPVAIAAVSMGAIVFPDEDEVQALMNLVSALCPIDLDPVNTGISVDPSIDMQMDEEEEDEQ